MGRLSQADRPVKTQSKRHRRLATGVVGSALMLAACSGSGPQTSLEPAGPFAREIDGLWNLVFWIAVAVFVLVEAGLVISIWKFREKANDDRRPKQLHGNTKLEVTWTVIPALLLAGLTIPMLQSLFELREVAEGPDVETVKVIGHQWWWEFQYDDFTTANELHIPAGVTVNLEMTSVDVIHSFWVPKLNGKRDVVPGRITNLKIEADEPTMPGFHPGQCAEFCGLAHADMRFRVYVHTPDEYEQWLADQAAPVPVPTEGVAAAGYETFQNVCTACHNATVMTPEGDVETIGPVLRFNGVFADLAPDLTHFGSRDSFGSAVFENDPDHLRRWLRDPSDLKPMEPDRNIIAPLGCVADLAALDEALEDALHAFDERLTELTGAEINDAGDFRSEAEAALVADDQVGCVVAAGEALDTLGIAAEETRILGMPNFGLSEESITQLIALLDTWE